jgi:hypothetical protein
VAAEQLRTGEREDQGHHQYRVVIVVVIWLLRAFGLLGSVQSLRSQWRVKDA